MTKKEKIQPLILKTLDNGSQPYLNIFESVKKNRGSLTKPSLNENLLKLLQEGKINLVGLDFDYYKKNKVNKKYVENPRWQTFYDEALIFEIVETKNIKIRGIISNYFSSDVDYQLKAEKDFIETFTFKIKDTEKRRTEKWNLNENLIYSRDLTDEELIWYDLENQIDWVELIGYDYSLEGDDKKGFFDYKIPQLLSKVPELRKKWEGIEIFYFRDLPEKPIITGNHVDSVKIRNNHIFTKKIPFDKDKFIEKRLGFGKPKNRDNKGIQKLFQEVSKYIKFNKEEQKDLIEKLAWALSDYDDSDELLNEIIKKATEGQETL